MHFEGIDVPLMEKAVRVYLRIAFAALPNRARCPVDFPACSSVDDVLEAFARDQRSGNMRKFALRLGNDRYPFMKLVFQELLVRNRFFFAVDTHDDLGLKDSFPDYEQWLELKRYNHRLKDEIERGWQAAGVPTFADLVAQVERETPPGPGLLALESAPLVLIVDDEHAIAHGVGTILARHGCRIRHAPSAESALEVIAVEKPDLVLSDLEMGGMSGLDLAARLRDDPATAGIPFILATAASIATPNFRLIDGFLVKPYETAVLLKFVQRHLAGRAGTGAGAGGGGDQP